MVRNGCLRNTSWNTSNSQRAISTVSRLNEIKQKETPREATPGVEKRRPSIRLGSLIGHGMKFTRYNAREERLERRFSESDIYSFLNDDNADDESTDVNGREAQERERERDGHRVMY